MTVFEPQHMLFDSVEAMIAPQNLSLLLQRPVTRAHISPLENNVGLSGASLQIVETDAGNLVLKRMSPDCDFIMYSTRDDRCRSITLWQYGILDQLAPLSRHGIIAGSLDGSGWAILMDHISCCLFSQDVPPPEDIHYRFIDSLAAMHAQFWQDTRLLAPELGLLTGAGLLEFSAWGSKPEREIIDMGELPTWFNEGWDYLDDILDPETLNAVKDFMLHPQSLYDAIDHQPATLVHGDYRYGNLAYRDATYIFDWQVASFSLCTIGLTWFIGDTLPLEEIAAYYRKRLESALGQAFEDHTWQEMLDLGIAAHAFRTICLSSYWAKVGDIEWRDDVRQEVIKKSKRLLDIRRRL